MSPSAQQEGLRAVVTLATGRIGAALGPVSHPLMRSYAERIGADFVVLLRPDLDAFHPYYRKLLLEPLFDTYARILFLDTDILVAPSAPDVFARVPPEKIGATRVDHLRPEESPPMRSGGIPGDIALIQEVLGEVGWRGPYFNTGVMLLSRVHRALLREAASSVGRWEARNRRAFRDQTLLNYWVARLRIPLEDLGHRFNHTPAFNRRAHRFSSFFIHYSGRRGHRRGNRLRQMRTDRWILAHPRILRFLADRPRVARVGDRLWPLPERLLKPWLVPSARRRG